jgi:hypothetical protein
MVVELFIELNYTTFMKTILKQYEKNTIHYIPIPLFE